MRFAVWMASIGFAFLSGCASPTEHSAVVGGGSWGRNHAQPVVGLGTTWGNGVETRVAWTPSIYADAADTRDEWGSFYVEAEIPIWTRWER